MRYICSSSPLSHFLFTSFINRFTTNAPEEALRQFTISLMAAAEKPSSPLYTTIRSFMLLKASSPGKGLPLLKSTLDIWWSSTSYSHPYLFLLYALFFLQVPLIDGMANDGVVRKTYFSKGLLRSAAKGRLKKEVPQQK
jgi:hypothetical protein